MVTDFIKCIGGIRDQFTEENFLVGVKSVDNQRQKLVDISGEGVALGFGRLRTKKCNIVSCKMC